MKSKKWIQEEIEFLKNNYLVKGNIELSKILNRSFRGVHSKLQRLNLKRPKEVYSSLINTDDWKNKISKTKKELYKIGKLKTWNKGLTKETDGRIKKYSELKKGKTRYDMIGDNNPSKRPEVRAKLRKLRHTEEAKRKISLAHKGKKFSKESKKKLSETRKKLFKEGKLINHFEGKKHKLETIEKIKKNHPNKSKKSSEWRKKISLKHKGKKISEETRKKLSLANKGKKYSEEVKKKISESHLGSKNPFYGKHHSRETKRRISKKTSGPNNANWQGGIGKLPYSFEFNKELKEQIRKRDNFHCQQCFRHESEFKTKLHIHHINFCRTDNRHSNLISLCQKCHAQTYYNRQDWIDYFKNKMVEDGKT